MNKLSRVYLAKEGIPDSGAYEEDLTSGQIRDDVTHQRSDMLFQSMEMS